MSARPRTGFIALLLAAFAGGLLSAWWLYRSGGEPGATTAAAPAERPRIEGDFALLDAQGRTVPWAQIGGRRQLVFFGFTHCPEACPTTLANATQALRELGEPAALRVVLVSVDPERDTPQRMGEYVANFGPAVVGYTGDAAAIAAAAGAFHVFYEKMPPMDDGGYMVNHTATLFLLGARDEILEIIPYGATPAEIAAALRRHPS